MNEVEAFDHEFYQYRSNQYCLPSAFNFTSLIRSRYKKRGEKVAIHDFGLGDVAECPQCGKEFEMNNLDDEEINDFDVYFEHFTTCDG